jgi:hypothetical protein
MLFARLQLRMPGARSVLLCHPRSAEGTSELAAALTSAISRAGEKARLLDVTDSRAPTDGTQEPMEVLESELTDVDRARRALSWPGGFTIVAAAGALESPKALVLAAAVDAVLLLARSGRTMRPDLTRSREEIEAVGGSVVGTVLLR